MNWYDKSKINLDAITQEQWQEINDRMIALGYDRRGWEDTKNIFKELPQIPEDQIKVLNAVLNKEEYIKQNDPKEIKSIFGKAIRYFGTTNNLQEAGYILPNGTLLDLSGKKWGGSGNTRALDHSEVNHIIEMSKFIEMGAIRHFPEQPGVDIRRMPTNKQLDIIYNEVNQSPNGYTLEIWDPRKGRFYNLYDVGVKGEKVINDIRRFYGNIISKTKNWYKLSQKLQRPTIEQIAVNVRKNMVKCYDDDCLKALCLPVSRKLKEELIRNGYDAIVVQGVFKIDLPNEEYFEDWDVEDFKNEQEMEEAKYTPLHYWVEVKDIIIDITASQFNDELDEPVDAIQIGSYADLERYIPIHKGWI